MNRKQRRIAGMRVRVPVAVCQPCQRAIYPSVSDCPKCGTETLTDGLTIVASALMMAEWELQAREGDGHAYIYVETNSDVSKPGLRK